MVRADFDPVGDIVNCCLLRRSPFESCSGEGFCGAHRKLANLFRNLVWPERGFLVSVGFTPASMACLRQGG